MLGRRESGYLYIYGILTNANPVALGFVKVTITAFNSSKQVVNDNSFYPAESGYIQAGQTKSFSTNDTGRNEEITSLISVVNPVDTIVVRTALKQPPTATPTPATVVS